MITTGNKVTITAGEAKGLTGIVVEVLGMDRNMIRGFRVLPDGWEGSLVVWSDEMVADID